MPSPRFKGVVALLRARPFESLKSRSDSADCALTALDSVGYYAIAQLTKYHSMNMFMLEGSELRSHRYAAML
jgi:hypothetical protein